MTQPLVHDLATPPKWPPHFRSFYFLYLFMLALPVAIFTVLAFLGEPPARDFMRDFRTTLPTVSEYTLVVCEAAHSIIFWPPVILAVLLLPWPLALYTARRPSHTQQLTIAFALLAVTQITSTTLTIIASYALVNPTVGILRSVSGR